MHKLIFRGLLFILCGNASANCNEQTNYNYNWIINNNDIYVKISPKNGKNFNYYNIDTASGYPLKGFVINNSEKIIAPKNINSIIFQPNIDEIIKIEKQKYLNPNKKNSAPNISNQIEYDSILNRINNLIYGNGHYYNYALISYSANQIYSLPLSEQNKLQNKTWEKKFNNHYMKEFNNVLKENNIKGIHSIKFYTTMIISPDTKQCAYFESSNINYDFDKFTILK